MQRNAFEASAQAAANAFADQNQQLSQVGDQAKLLMDSARDNLTEGLADVDSKIKSMSDVVQHELESFRTEYQQNLESFFASCHLAAPWQGYHQEEQNGPCQCIHSPPCLS